MSQIFEALRRTEVKLKESERGGSEAAIEILRRAEQQQQDQFASADPDQAVMEREHFIDGLLPDLEPRLAEPSISFAPDQRSDEQIPDSTDSSLGFPAVTVALHDESKVPCLTDKKSPTAEALRLLTVRVRELRRSLPIKTVLITSTIPQEGKSFIASNLAIALAEGTDQKVLLLEGDVRCPTVADQFGIEGHAGLCEWVDGIGKLSESIVHLASAGIWLLPAGSAPENPLDILQSKKLPKLVASLAERFDWVIIDSPPVLPLADTSIWSNLADGVLLVTRQGTTHRKELRRGLEAIDPRKMIGAVVNSSTQATSSDYYYYQSPKTQSNND